jgi:hypothetical protein
MELSQSQIIKWSKRILPVVFGAAGGYAYYYFIGCASGTCRISSNPYISTIYGSVIGALLIPRVSKSKEGMETTQP